MQKAILAIAGVAVVLIVVLVIVSWRHPLAFAAWVNRRALQNAGLKKQHLSTPVGTQTFFAGGKGSTIILLHGAGDQAGAWSKVAPALVKQYRVIVPDLAGHGDSEPKSGPLSVGAIEQALEAVANAQPGKVIIVGNSLGGWIACLYARRYPAKIERLVLVNGGPLTGERPDVTLTPQNREEAHKTLSALFDPGSIQFPEYVVDDIVRESQTGPLKRLSETASDMPQYLMDGRLNESVVPVNLLWGESDQVMSLKYARRMQSQLPAAELVTLPRCGHAPPFECPKAFTARLNEILQSPLPARKAVLSGAPAK